LLGPESAVALRPGVGTGAGMNSGTIIAGSGLIGLAAAVLTEALWDSPLAIARIVRPEPRSTAMRSESNAGRFRRRCPSVPALPAPSLPGPRRSCLPYRPRQQLGAPAGAAAHSLVSGATGFIAAKDAVALRAWGIGPSKDRRAEGRNAWLGLGYQREFCTATTGFVRNLSGSTLRNNGIHLRIASAARTLLAVNDDRGRDGGGFMVFDDDRMRPGRQRV
jgi:hypothetical protein